MKRVQTNHIVLALAAVVVICLWASCNSGTAPSPRPSVTVAQDSIALTVGQTGQLNAQAANATNPALSWNSSNTTIATVDNNGLVTGRAVGSTYVSASLTAQPSVKDSAKVIVTLPAVTITLDSIKMGNTRVTNNTVSGTIRAHYRVNVPPGVMVDVTARIAPQAAQSCGSLTGAGVAITSMDVQAIECQLNTSAFNATTGVPNILNGPNSLTAEVFFRPQGAGAGTQVASISQQLTITNQSGFFMQVTNAPSSAQSAVNPSVVSVNVLPVVYTQNPSSIRVGIVPTTTSGTGTLVFNQQQLAPPATFTVNTTATGSIEGVVNLTPRAFDAATGADITNSFAAFNPLPIRLDNIAPRVTTSVAPPSQFDIEQFALRLGHPAGPYAATTVIPVTRINGLQVIGPHGPNCPTHGHGSITIVNGIAQGPFQDPEFTVGDPCGWGPIGNFVLPALDLPIATAAFDAYLQAASIRIAQRGGATCDNTVILVDDVLVTQGTGIGQSPMPTVTFFPSATDFSSVLKIFADLSMVGSSFCVSVIARDNTVGTNNVAAPNTTVQTFTTTVIR